MASFPSELPGPRIGSVEIGEIDPWVEDAPEVGSGRRRARFTRSLKTFDFTIRITDQQLATLQGFYTTTLGKGVDSFTWTNTQDSTAYTVRFAQRFRERNVTLGVWDVPMSLVEV